MQPLLPLPTVTVGSPHPFRGMGTTSGTKSFRPLPKNCPKNFNPWIIVYPMMRPVPMFSGLGIRSLDGPFSGSICGGGSVATWLGFADGGRIGPVASDAGLVYWV